MSRRRPRIPHLALALLGLALLGAAAAAPRAAAACDPGRFGHIPPQGCRAPGGEPSRALPSPAAAQSGGVRPRFHLQDDCERVAGWAPAHHQTLHGIHVRFYWVWVEDGRTPNAVALVCGGTNVVHGTSRGPGAGGVSLPCPMFQGHRRTRPHAVGWWVSARAAYTSVAGGFGHNRDGFWNYRFYNPHAAAARARLYGSCLMPPPGHS